MVHARVCACVVVSGLGWEEGCGLLRLRVEAWHLQLWLGRE